MTLPRTAFAIVAVASLSLLGISAASSASADAGGHSARTTTSFDLPVGFQPEGIDIGARKTAYLGSLADGSIYAADLRTGQGRIISAAVGIPAVGVEAGRGGQLFVSGGGSGTARVVDTRTGEVLAQYQLAPAGAPSFINDVVVVNGAAWFTDSINPVIYRVPLGAGGGLPAAAEVTALPLTGDLAYDDDPSTFEVNGIESTPDRRALLVVQSSTGLLFRVDPVSGATITVDLDGELLTNGDGLTRDGRTLYAVQNRNNQVAVIHLARDGRSGEVQRRISDPRFEVPTTVAVSGGRIYLPNARFGTPSPQTASYSVTGVPLR